MLERVVQVGRLRVVDVGHADREGQARVLLPARHGEVLPEDEVPEVPARGCSGRVAER